MIRPLASAVLAAAMTFSASAQSSPAAPPPTDLTRLTTALNTFAATLHRELGDTATCSPASIGIALLMVLPGARGETATELERVLALPSDLRGERLHAAARELICLLRGTVDGETATELRLCNDVWLQKDFALLPDYVKALRHQFDAAANDVDFVGEPEAARAAINDKVAEVTDDRIRDLVPADLITPDTRVVLTNATWLRGYWLHAFREKGTKPAPFVRKDGSLVEVPTMNVVEKFGYAEDEAMQFVRLPFADGDVVCDLVLPKANVALADAERALLQGDYVSLLAPQMVKVALPKFTVAGKLRLKEVLMRLGLKTAFDEERADFSGMRNERDLCIDEVVHQTWVAVDENGAEAAAATAVVMKRAGGERPKEPKVFAADRPFAFVLRHRSGLLLFVGRVEDPSVAR
ncbi:MAG: serpin family protein [Planctomycetota bacterium]